MTRRQAFLICAWSCAALWLLASHSPAQQAGGHLQFRQVYVPEDRLEDVAAGYIPVKKETFERLVATLGAVPNNPGAASVRLAEATYSATLEQSNLVNGSAQLKIVHDNTESAILQVAPCSLAIGAASWLGGNAPEARLGTDAAGNLAIVVEPTEGNSKTARTSELRFGWTQRGARDPAGSLIFDLRTPACPATRMTLSLPKELTPTVTHGIITKGPQSPADNTKVDWTIELGGRTRTTLTIVSQDLLKRQQRYVLLREAADYEVTREALAATFQQRLDIFQQPLRQLAFRLDPGLRVTTITLEGTELTWNITPGDAGTQQRLVVEFPEPVIGRDRVLEIKALAPLNLDRPWMLPRAVAQEVVWQEGTAQVRVAPELELCDLMPREAHQAGGDVVGGTIAAANFHYLAPEAGVEILVRRGKPRIRLNEGLTLKWDGPHLTGQLISNVVAAQGTSFQLQAQVLPGWIVDSVETVPSDALDDWTVSTKDGRVSQLNVRFAKALTPEQPLQLKVVGHRRAAARNERLQAREYRFVEWSQATQQRRLVAVQTESQQQLTVVGDLGLQRLDLRELGEADRALLDTNLSRLVFLDESAGAGFLLALRDEQPRFTAKTSSQISVSREAVAEEHSIRIVPDATPLARVVVRFSATLPGAVEWRQNAQGGNDYTARQLAADNSELWELTFLRPFTSPRTMVATRQTTLRPGDPLRALPLVSVNDAETQQGEVVVVALEGTQPIVHQQGLRPSLIAEADDNVRARFQYQYSPEQKLAIEHVGPKGRAALAWAWHHRQIARVDAVGSMVCTSHFAVENSGEPQISLRLPADATLRHVKVNQVRLPVVASVTKDVVIPLPDDQRYPLVQVEYVVTDPARRLWQDLRIHKPIANIPVLQEETEIWLAPELRVVHSTDSVLGNWRSRLLGSFARPVNAPAPSLFERAAWTLPGGQSAITNAQSQSANACSLALDVALRRTNTSESPTWGTWLLRYVEVVESSVPSVPQLRVDAVALAEVGIYGSTPLETSQATNHAELLANNGAVLLLQDDRIVLTTHRRLSELTNVAPHAESFYVATADAGYNNAQAITLAAWLARPPVARLPWSIDDVTSHRDLLAAGWQRHAAQSGSGDEVVSVYRWKDIEGIAWGLMLLIVGLCACLVRRSSSFAAIAVATAAVVALWLPLPLAACGSALFVGSILGTVTGLANWRWPTALRRTVAVVPRPAKHPSAIVTFVLIALVLWWRPGAAQERPRPVAPAAHRVLVPIDAEQKPSGEYVYLPREFYETLVRRANQANAIPQGWIIYEATYRGQLQSTMPGRLQFVDLAASYDLEVFQPGTRVVIGLGREHVHLIEGRVTLEAAPLDVEWLESGEGFTFLVEKAGRYRLELAIRPTATIAGVREQIDLRIPSLANAVLHLKAPREASGVQVAGATGHTSQLEPGSWRVELGPAPRLTVYWPSGEGQETPKSDIESTQLLWWKVRPGAVVLESQWTFNSISQPLGEVRLIADPRLKLLPFAEDQPIAKQSIREGDVQAIQLTLKEPENTEQTIRARFAFTDSSGIGRLMLPRLEAVGVRNTQSWLAVTATDGLETSPSPGTTLDAVTRQDFASAWGEMQLPDAAYRLPPDAAGVAIDVRPRPAAPIVRQALTYVIGSRTTKAELEAIVQVSDGPLFQHRLQLPSDWNVERATLTQANIESSLRFALGNNGQYTIFLPPGVSGEHRLLIAASGPAIARQPATLPDIRLLSSDNDSPVVFLERTYSVAVTLADHPGYELVEDASTSPVDVRLRRVAVLRPQSATASRQIQVDVQRQSATLRARHVAMLQRRDNDWQVVLDIQGEVVGGLLDTLRWELPAEYQDLQLSLPAQLKITAIPGQSRFHLVAHLDQPLQGKFAAQLTFPLTGLAAERLQLPEIRMLDADALQSYVALPTDIDGQQLTWETRGLQPAALPREDYPSINDSALVMAAPSGRFQVSVKRLERIAGVPQVRLADVMLSVAARHKAAGVVSLDLEPAGLNSCILQVPEGQSLVAVMVNGTPALATPGNTSEFHIALQHEQLPQHIEVTYTAQLPDNEVIDLQAPMLVGIPLERTLWTIAAPAELSISVAPEQDAPLLDADRQEAFRIRNATTLLEQAATYVPEGKSDQAKTWFGHWVRRSVRLQAWFARQHAHDDPSAAPLATNLESLATEAQAMGQQWGATDVIAAAMRDAAESNSSFALAAIRQEGASQVVRTMLPGSLSNLEVTINPAASQATITRIGGTVVIAILFVALAVLLQSVIVREALLRWPQVIGIVAGIGWWFLLTPAGVGLLIAVLFAIASLRWPWPRSPELSRVLRVSPRRQQFD